ncbi:MAG TPA: head maturation protease, ClpP-related [Actinomycetes bacterium]|nr:head maturation protease, ClpP-related [Actinomycetes bacterium]
MSGIRELLPPGLLRHHRAPANRDRGAWYSVRNQAAGDDDRAIVDLYDVIGEWGVSAQEFVRDLREIDASVIELHINSPGGLIHDGLTIYNGLRDHPARVEAIVDGIAASAASWILQAGEIRTMNRHTELMIHDGLAFTIGNEQDHLDTAALLGRLSENIASIYAERAGGTVEDWRAAMRTETWYTADEAVDVGLADDVITDDDGASNHSTRAELVTHRARVFAT